MSSGSLLLRMKHRNQILVAGQDAPARILRKEPTPLTVETGAKLSSFTRHLVSEGLLIVTITATVFIWGGMFLEGMLDEMGLPFDAFNPLTRDMLAAPFGTVLMGILGLALLLLGFGFIGLYSAVGRILLRKLGHKLAYSRFKRVSNFVRSLGRTSGSKLSTEKDEEVLDQALELSSAVLIQGGMLFLLLFLATYGAFAAADDGRERGEATLKACILGKRGYWSPSVGDTLNFCIRINEDVIWYSRRLNAVKVEKWNGQSITAPFRQ